ncbi:hypothetical protein BO70DRAFT_12794 [Aspergillus heteromorphus CBS 117.55]|uniref:Uncharacterized protein n=1 Tax=Aspergillus heteromorphus CBS 117.55 TaxID=1448321 RepID=A0A317X6K4_9EURO|nr:uncharacterized protein BO70DRAFT_12794 [Aspergillus heteromorphus CBS 117.55]PWY92508.1 hypothetical protein BO70DRAFT_12794 [Aspergillus heteromorphus CBS 117.55]
MRLITARPALSSLFFDRLLLFGYLDLTRIAIHYLLRHTLESVLHLHIMSTIARNRYPLRTSPGFLGRILYTQPRRPYAHSSYGGEGESDPKKTNNPQNKPTRDIEHPDTETTGPVTQGTRADTPSNKARPALAEDHPPYVDKEGNPTGDVPQDVKKHNEELENRYDHPKLGS